MKREQLEVGGVYGWSETRDWESMMGRLQRAVVIELDPWHHPDGYGVGNRRLSEVPYKGETRGVRGERTVKGQGAQGILVDVGTDERPHLRVIRTAQILGDYQKCVDTRDATLARIQKQRDEQRALADRDAARRPVIYDALEARGLLGDREDNRYAYSGSLSIRLSHLEQLLGLESPS